MKNNIYVSLDLRARESEDSLHYHVNRVIKTLKKKLYRVRKENRPTITIELLHVPVCYVSIVNSKEIHKCFTLIGYKEFFEE